MAGGLLLYRVGDGFSVPKRRETGDLTAKKGNVKVCGTGCPPLLPSEKKNYQKIVLRYKFIDSPYFTKKYRKLCDFF